MTVVKILATAMSKREHDNDGSDVKQEAKVAKIDPDAVSAAAESPGVQELATTSAQFLAGLSQHQDPQLEALREACANATPETFQEAASSYCRALLVHHQGPLQYLLAEHGDTRDAFYAEMAKLLPERHDVSFSEALPHNDETIFAIYPWALSFSPTSSTKPAPFLSLSLRLLDEIFVSGFVTQGRVLFLK